MIMNFKMCNSAIGNFSLTLETQRVGARALRQGCFLLGFCMPLLSQILYSKASSTSTNTFGFLLVKDKNSNRYVSNNETSGHLACVLHYKKTFPCICVYM